MSAEPIPPPPTPWRAVWLLALIPALDAVLRLGRLHPDEVFQHLEPAMVKAFGAGVTAWEWQVGLRNWAVPGLFALLLKAAAAVGLTDVQARRAVLALPQLCLHAGMLAAVWRFARRRVGEPAAFMSLVLVGLSAPLTWFAGRTMGESLSAAFLVWGLERLDARGERAWVPLAGGVLLGGAEVTRYGSAAVIVPAMVVLLAQRRWRDFGLAAAGGAVVALALGLLDKLTWGATLQSPRWGGWWHSLLEYLDFNLVSGRAAQQFGAEPFGFYGPSLLVAPFAVVGLALWAWRRAQRSAVFLVPALAYLGAIAATPHKEPRFIYPALVLLVVAGTPAFAAWALEVLGSTSLPKKALAAAALAGSLLFYVVPTPLDVQRPEQFQLIVRAAREGHGLVLMNEGLWGSGGSFYLGGPRPFCTCDFPHDPCFQSAARDGRFDRVIFTDDTGNPARNAEARAAFEAAGFRLVEKDGVSSYFARAAP